MKVLFTICYLLFASFTLAANEEFFVSWQSDSYVPYSYQGKAMPTNNSNIIVALELLSDKKPVNLSQKMIRWHLDNKLYQSGVGLKTISFKADFFKRSPYEVKVSVFNYNGNELSHLIIIPLAEPETVIDAPYHNNLLRPGINLIKGLFYFFDLDNVNQLNWNWAANGITKQTRAQNPDILELEIPAGASGGSVNLDLIVKSKKNEFEFANDSKNFYIK